MSAYADIPASARLTFEAIESKVRCTATTFRGSYATAQKRDEAVEVLNAIADQARLASALLQSARVVEGAAS